MGIHEERMDYVIKKGNLFYYSRRVPKIFREYDPRLYVRIALKTDSRKQAVKLAMQQNEHVERHWHSLVGSGQKHQNTLYQDAIARAAIFGFTYIPNVILAAQPPHQIIERLMDVEKNDFNPVRTEAVLGGLQQPKIKLDEAFSLYCNFAKDKILNKSSEQIRKWRTPRKKALKNFIHVVGNKTLDEVTRDDTLKFRDWWLSRIEHEHLVSNSANKNFIQLKVIFETISDNLKLELDIDHLFKKLILKEEDMGTRKPFTTEWIITKLLNEDNLRGLDTQAKWALYAFAETGAGVSELVGLRSENIILESDTPHIRISKHKQHSLKTRYRPREIPLVGFALDAFRACHQGFTDYYQSPDYLSARIGGYLRENGLLPTEDHTTYSLRHSFQDRLLAVNAPDRVQADLMGHKFNRPSYGEGASLAQKLEWLSKIELKA